jgi:hypothetical protein
MFNHAIARLALYHPKEALDLALTALDRSRCFASPGSLEKELWQIISRIAIGFGDERAQKRLDDLLASGVKDGRLLTATLIATRPGLAYDSEDEAEKGHALRARAVEWYRRVAEAALNEFEQLNARYPDASQAPREARDHATELLKVFDAIATDLYFAADVREHRDDDKQPLADAQRKRLLRETTELIERLATVRHPHVVHHLVELLHGVAHLSPKRSTQLLEAVCGGRGQVELVHLERLIVRRIVDVVQMLLADHRDQLTSDPEMQASVVAILDGFVAVGWPDAQKLIFRLEEVSR